MKRSRSIQLTIVAAISLAACDQQHCVTNDEGETECTEVKHCVSEDGTVVEDTKCDKPTGSPDSHAGAMPFRWFYGGTRGITYTPGSKISTTEGSFSPSTGHSYSSPATIGRGGFGSIGHGVSAGE